MKQRQYNLDKTAYDLEKENKRFIWKFFTYLYFLLFSLRNFKEIYIMCGIIGFTGNLQAPGILVDGLQQLEYRGYDSAGIAVNNGSETKIVKTTGKVATLREKVEAAADLAGTCGIGHTRWATHGGVTEVNAHPHVSGNVTLIHNGIIENYKELAASLKTKGFTAISETDTEVAAMLIDSLYDGDPFAALKEADKALDGAYGFCVMFKDHPGEIYCMRNASPLVASHTEDGSFIASDMVALVSHTKHYFVLKEGHIAKLTKDEIIVKDENGEVYGPYIHHISWDMASAKKGGYDYFMMKEIHEQPKAVQDTLNSVIKDGKIDLSNVEITEDEIKNFEQIYIVACGSAWHVGMAAQYVLEDMADIPVRVELASEFRYRKMPFSQKALVIVVSQSGETADTPAALRLAKEKGIITLAVVNVVGSSIAREADKVFYTLAGPEISVATTKAYSAQLAAMYCLAVQFAKVREKITEEQYSYYISELLTIPEKMQKILEDKERIQWFAAKYANAQDVFFVGRGIDYAVCLEGSLKLKEISYIHSEAYAAGELKHGTISLIEQGTLVIGVLTQSDLYEKTISNMLECKSRGAYLMGLTTYGKYETEDQVNFTVYVPKVDEHFVGSLAVIPLQLLGYYVSVAKGLDVDKPRNLAKSVTVE